MDVNVEKLEQILINLKVIFQNFDNISVAEEKINEIMNDLTIINENVSEICSKDTEECVSDANM